MSDRTIRFAIRVLAGTAAAGSLALALWIVIERTGLLASEPIAPAVSASLLIESFTCRRGETRTVLRRGVEDGYAPGNFEPSRPDRAGPQRIEGVGFRDFDDSEPDQDFYDYFEPPRDAVSGLFVIRMTEDAGSTNDGILMGDIVALNSALSEGYDQTLSVPIGTLRTDPSWSVSGDVYSADIASLTLSNSNSLLDQIRAPETSGFVDVVIADDTAVDFMAMAICSPPESNTGLTFWYDSLLPDAVQDGPVRASCQPRDQSEEICDPFVGNTSCTAELPLMCFRPGTNAIPDIRGDGVWEFYPRFWTGGDFALTDPVAADRFSTRGEVDAFCQTEFGDDWRLADFHLGGRGFEIVANGPVGYEGRVWIDIRDQPYATCWGRE